MHFFLKEGKTNKKKSPNNYDDIDVDTVMLCVFIILSFDWHVLPFLGYGFQGLLSELCQLC